MAVWKEYKIGDLCDTISETYRGHDEEVILINTSDVLEGRILNHQKVPNRNVKGQFKKTFKTQDILYSEIRPENNRFAYVDMKDTSLYIASTKLMVIRANIEIIEPRFLYAILTAKSMTQELQVRAELRSGTFPQITFKTELATIKVCVPDRNTQKKIVSFLDAINRKIEMNNKINRNLQEQALAIYNDLFGNAKKESTIDEVTINVTDGVHNTVKDDTDGEFYLLSCKNIKGGSFSLGASERRISRETFEKLRKRTKLEKGDILLSSVGTIGEILLLKFSPDQYEFQRSVAIIKPNSRMVSSVYLFFALLAQKQEIVHAAHGAVQQCLFISDIKRFPIHKPQISLLKKFDDAVVPMMEMIYKNEEENKRILELRDSLLPKLMSGELDVLDFDI